MNIKEFKIHLLLCVQVIFYKKKNTIYKGECDKRRIFNWSRALLAKKLPLLFHIWVSKSIGWAICQHNQAKCSMIKH